LDWAKRYPGIAAAVGKLGCRSCLLDGEVVAYAAGGAPSGISGIPSMVRLERQ
jgi:ATP-dependent DNA ligase